MQVHFGASAARPSACALTIGNFDGVHRGHQAMLALLNSEAAHRGVESCVLTFEPQAWSAGGLYLLAAVLERYLALQVSINGFVRTSVQLRGRSGTVAAWPARSGTRVLL